MGFAVAGPRTLHIGSIAPAAIRQTRHFFQKSSLAVVEYLSHYRLHQLRAVALEQGLDTCFRRRIACKQTLALLGHIIDSTNVLHPTPGVGLPIGNLTSQLCANIYLHELDEFVKHGLQEKHYARYMDDFIVVHHDKAHLQAVRIKVEAFLQSHLRLHTNKKTQVFPLSILHGR
ncbi:MAG: RNA-directed DNA polymerase, partial [Betaproteobacteria bacterium]|nr:RNA-directed DNA polymerase [Betaproteobacteria bacterium]